MSDITDIIDRKINITSVEDTEKKVILHDGKLKFYFWKTKQDGNKTKAYTQFLAGQILTGKYVEASVKEEDREFVNDKGKNIKYRDRNILGFNGVSEAQAQPSGDRLEKMAQWAATKDDEIKTLKERIATLEEIVIPTKGI